MVSLGEDCREILTLIGLEYRYNEIAEISGINIGTVMSRLSRCRKKLKERRRKLMNKSDFSPEELDELLVAFADNELDGDQKFIEELISSDAEVNGQFLEFKKSGEMLRALFNVEGVNA